MQQGRAYRHRGFTLVELLVMIGILSILAAILFPAFGAAREKARQTGCLSNQRQLAQAILLYAEDHDDTLPYFGDRWPDPTRFWPDLLPAYMRDRRIMECASWPKSGKYRNQEGRLADGAYGVGVVYGELFAYTFWFGQFNRAAASLLRVEKPSQTLLLTDSQGGIHVYTPVMWPMTVDWDRDGTLDSHPRLLRHEAPYNRGDPFRHSGGSNCTFLDGHSRWIAGRSWLTNRGGLWANSVLPE